MASLTPGLLIKLVDNAGNKDVKVTGEHRSALLQVVEILPSFSGSDDPLQNRGFFLKVSDSLHSVYVTIPEEDMELIYSDKIQLGQFIYVSRLDSGSPVPVLRGLKPVAKRRPCVGNPKDLLSSDVLPVKNCVNFSKQKKAVDSKARKRDSFGNGTKVEGLELRRLSLDSARRVWDHNQMPKSNTAFKASININSEKRASSKSGLSLKHQTSTKSPLKSKNEDSPSTVTAGPLKKDFKSTTNRPISSCLVKVPLNSKTWLQRISWNALPPVIHELGKETVHHRNNAFLAAVSALEESSAAESIILCMQTFAELCSSCPNISSGPLVEQYLDFYQQTYRAALVVHSLLSVGHRESISSFFGSQQFTLPDGCKTKANMNAASWVNAAIETNLSKFTLFKRPEKSEMVSSDKCHYVVLGIPDELNSGNQLLQNRQSPRNHAKLSDLSPKLALSSLRYPSATKKMDPKREYCPKGSGLKEMAHLAEMLLLHSREWFLKYIESSLNDGFRFCMRESNEIALLLRQLKRVNQWLDHLGDGGIILNERIEKLRKKLYGFLLEHVECAVASSK